MKTASVHPKEQERLQVLRDKKILDSDPDPRFDTITKRAVEGLGVPISTITLVDENREWYKSCIGLESQEGPREISFCGHALLEHDVLICEDTLEDERFLDNPYVIGKPHVRFYAGMRLLDRETGLPLGVFCVKDIKPRKFSVKELALFMELAAKAENLIQ